MVRDEVVVRLVATGKWAKVTAELGERAKYRCEYCDLDLLATPEHYKMWQVDHIVPTSCGGDPADFNNLAITCNTCNWDWKRDWNPRTAVGSNATRAELIEAVRDHIRGPRARTEKELEIIREIVGYSNKVEHLKQRTHRKCSLTATAS